VKLRRKAFLLLVILLFIPITAFADYDYNSKEFQEVVSQLYMQGHANDELSTCKVKQMYYDEVTQMLNDGMKADEIIQFYVDEYGQAALKEPATDKSGLIAWGMPVVGVLAGIAVVGFWLRKIKVKNKVEAKEQDLSWDSELDKEITAKIFEEERRKHF